MGDNFNLRPTLLSLPCTRLLLCQSLKEEDLQERERRRKGVMTFIQQMQLEILSWGQACHGR